MPSLNHPDAAATTSLRYDLPGDGHVLFTSRAHANLSTQTGDGHEHGRAARDRLCEELGLDWLCASRQVHGSTVQRVSEIAGSGGEAIAIDADGHATALAGVGVMVLTADCLPVALGAETSGGGAVVAMAHAGWRGLAAGVLEEAVRALHKLGATGPIEAVVGPCAGACCYEVGEEVHAAFAGLAGADGVGSTAEEHRRGKNIDLRAIARDKLLAAGVASVSHAEACTICDERFFSHRRQGKAAGRQAGIAWIG
ncbi:MAG TPA: polyphenol oxidase family protein [Solirubrobacteraceae bacterium]|nr:polyphenol oxidase family protein [Solirubrobacteraceae bacterium]